MKILLISPARKPEWGESFWDLKTFVKLSGKKAAGALLALPTLAALTPSDVDISIIDENVEPIDFKINVDLVGISFLTSLAPRAYEIADEFRKRNVKVVLGGIHASMLPEEAIQHADSVVIGEAEETWPELVKDFKKGKLKKFYKAQCFPLLDSSPIPRWDLLDTDAYSYFTIQTGRGCPFDCDFCSVHVFNGRKYRHKPIDGVIEELKFLKRIDSRKHIFFADDNFLARPSYATNLLKKIKLLDIEFWIQSSVNRLDDEEMLKNLAEAGCTSVFIGFESVLQKNLDSVNKSKVNNVLDYKKIVEKVHLNGISVFGSFVLGLDSDKRSSFEDISNFIKDSNIAFSMINILTPLPGSSLYFKLRDENRLNIKSWQCCDVEKICFKPKNLTTKELENGRLWLLSEIYSYDALYERLKALWRKGTFVRKGAQRKIFTKGRIYLTFLFVMNRDFVKLKFILRSLWNKNITSIKPIILAVSFNEYFQSLMKYDD